MEDEQSFSLSLEAALSFLENFEPRAEFGLDLDAVSAASIELPSLPASPAAQDGPEQTSPPETVAVRGARSKNKAAAKRPRKKTTIYNPNRARDERRGELVYLRNKVREMEGELKRLKASAEQSQALALTTNGGSSKRRTVMLSDAVLRDEAAKEGWSENSVWKQLAARQGAERHKSELENIRLRSMLEGQIKVAKTLEKLLKRRPNMQHLNVQSIHPYGTKHLYSIPMQDENDESIFADLMAGVEQVVSELDAICEANGLSKTERPYQDAVIREDGLHAVCLEVFANKIVPFDMKKTSDAVYEHFTRAIKHMPYRSYQQKKTEESDDTLVEIFGVELQAKRTSAHFRMHQVLRRFVQEDRVVIAWKSSVNPVAFSLQPTSGVHMEESGFAIIRRPETMSSDYSLIQTCYIMTPRSRDPSQINMVGQLANFFLDANVRHIDMSHQMIENRLMAMSLTS